MKVVLVVGNDKIGRKALKELSVPEKVKVVLDGCTNSSRTLKLVKRGILPIAAIFKMAFANVLRRNTTLNEEYEELTTNKCLLKLVDEETNVILFRAGLIVNKEVIGSVKNILNIHCARIPDFGGIASIHRAITAKSYDQEATLHKVTTKIDGGEVMDVEPYQMRESYSYFKNEEIAYDAGIDLLKRTVQQYAGR